MLFSIWFCCDPASTWTVIEKNLNLSWSIDWQAFVTEVARELCSEAGSNTEQIVKSTHRKHIRLISNLNFCLDLFCRIWQEKLCLSVVRVQTCIKQVCFKWQNMMKSYQNVHKILNPAHFLAVRIWKSQFPSFLNKYRISDFKIKDSK